MERITVAVVIGNPCVALVVLLIPSPVRGERVRVRDIRAARLSVAPHILIFGTSENLVPHPPCADATSTGLPPRGGEGKIRFAQG